MVRQVVKEPRNIDVCYNSHMKDIYPMWRMCLAFRDREMSRNRDHIIEELKSQNLSGSELEKRIVIERANGKNYPLSRGEMIGAYTHKFYPELRRDGDTVSAEKVIEKKPSVVDEAHAALNNCIDSNYIQEKDDDLYLTGKGRMFADPPYFFGINMRLLVEYLKTIDPLHGLVLGTITYFVLQVWKDVPSLPSQFEAIINLLIHYQGK